MLAILIGSGFAYSSFDKVQLLPGIDSYFGYINVTVDGAQDAGMFFQYYPKIGQSLQNPNANTPLVIWMNGGPGSSSHIGSFTQVGPLDIFNDTNNNQQIRARNISWAQQSHIVFVDQPVTGVGFSFVRPTNITVNSTVQSSGAFVQFYNKLISGPLSKLKGNPLYISGESFGGHYAPYYTYCLLKAGVKVQGMMIVDGWTDPLIEGQHFSSILKSWGFVGGLRSKEIQAHQANYVAAIQRNKLEIAHDQFQYLTGDDITAPAGDFSVYNMFKYNDGSVQPYHVWLLKNKDRLKVPDYVDFHDVSEQVYNAFKLDIVTNYANYVKQVANKIKVVVINGQLDYIVNTESVLTYLSRIGLLNGRSGPWRINKKVVGKVYQGIVTLAVVNLAGHTVPSDQPMPSLDALRHLFQNNKNWNN